MITSVLFGAAIEEWQCRIRYTEQPRELGLKAAQQRRTPKRSARKALSETATFWSAAVLCRFQFLRAWLLRSPFEQQSIEQQQDHGADDRHNPAGDVILARKDAPDPGAN